MEFSIALDTESLAAQLKLSADQIRQAMELVDSGNSIPFIACYRRERTGGLGEEDLRELRDAVESLRTLNDRKCTVLRAIHGQGKLTDELEQAVRAAPTSRALEDIYLPYKRTKRTRLGAARRDAIQPLVCKVLAATEPLDLLALVKDVVGPGEFANEQEALAELELALGEHLLQRPGPRDRVRNVIRQRAVLVTRRAPDSGAEDHAAEDHAAGEHATKDHDIEDHAAEDHGIEDHGIEDHGIEDHGIDEHGIDEHVADEHEEEYGEAHEDEHADEQGMESPDADASAGDAGATSSSVTPFGGDLAPPVTEASDVPTDIGMSVTAPAVPELPGEQVEARQNRLRAIASIARQRRQQRREARKKRRARLEGSFRGFLNFRRHAHKILPSEWLTIDYGERVRVLDVDVELDADALVSEAWTALGLAGHPHADLLKRVVGEGLRREKASLIREVQRDAVEQAEVLRLSGQRRRLSRLLRQKPVVGNVLAIEPRLRREATLAVLDSQGALLHHESLACGGSEEAQQAAAARLAAVLNEHAVRLVAIGDIPGARDVDHLLRRMVKSVEGDWGELRYAEVAAAGANIYAKGARAAKEFPNHPDNVRRAVVLGRRLQDPLREFLKIDAIRLGRALFGEENKSPQFNTLMQDVYRSCLAEVRLDANEAEGMLFRYLPGLNPAYAQRLEQRRAEVGGFGSRGSILATTGIDEAALQQAIGFLHVRQSDEPLDRTPIHPQRYELAHRILTACGLVREDLLRVLDAEHPASAPGSPGDSPTQAWRAALAALQPDQVAAEWGVDPAILKEVLYQLRQVGRVPRTTYAEPLLRSPQVNLSELRPGDELIGVVVNIVDYGAFLELGPGSVGLLHVSRMADGFVGSPREVVQEGEALRVWVAEVEPQKGRISLALTRQRSPVPAPAPREPRGDRFAHGASRGGPPPRRGGGGRQDTRPPVAHEPRKKPRPAPVVPITDAMKDGKEPMRTFSDLMQFYQQERETSAPPSPPKSNSDAAPLPPASQIQE